MSHVPVTWNEVYARCKRVMLSKGRALTAIQALPPKPPILWESELKQNGKTKVVPDLWKLALELAVVEDGVEVPHGEQFST